MGNPVHVQIPDDMISFAEEHHAARGSGRAAPTISVHDPFRDLLGQRLAARGYQPSTAEPDWMSERPIDRLVSIGLPPGFTIHSRAETDDLDARRTVLGLAFAHADPAEWATAQTYRELQRAPDYRKDLDLVVVSLDSAFAACCIAWHDPVNRVGTLEPVGTHPAYRRRGIGRAVIYEGLNRLAALGALKAWVGPGQVFYETTGFKRKYREIRWKKDL